MFLSKAKGILGMNARNLLYVARFNTKTDKRFADDKIYTKNFLSSRGIGVAKIYAVIRSYKELRQFQPSSLPEQFVIKPNHGFGGEGIIVIVGRQGDRFLGIGGERWTWHDLFSACVAVLDGKYAISGLRDEVIIEERLEPHEYFRPFAPQGLPDVRVIVFNLIPVIAMLRLPTAESQGKANLHLGAIGLGVDLGTGKTTHAVQHGKFITRLPNGDRVNSMQIPDWEELLLTAALCQKVSDIGYLAVDLASTIKGIKMLELNARAGLSVQIANRVFLKSRLEKVSDLKVIDPKQGVEIAQTLFATKPARAEKEIDTKRILGLYEPVRILNAEPEHVTAKIDPHAESLVVDESVTLPSEESALSLQLRGEKLIGPFARAPLPAREYQLIIPGKLLKGFLINVETPKTERAKSSAAQKSSPDEKIILNIDKKLYEVGRQIHFLARLKPAHLEQVRALFLSHPTVSPVFSYPPLDLDVDALRKELAKLPRDIAHPLAPLFLEKIDELDTRLALIAHRGTSALTEYSISLYGEITEEEFKQAREWAAREQIEEDTSETLSLKEVEKRLRAYLQSHHLRHWKITILENAAVDMQVNKTGTILLHKNARITAHRLRALIAHEIDTHVYRQENGKLSPYRIFEQGTAKYLETEEGLALLNAEQVGVPTGEKRLWAAWNAMAIWHGRGMGFAELFQFLKKEYQIADTTAWRICLKVKRGLTDTAQPGVFTKDRVYFFGYTRVKEFYAKQGNEGMQQLYKGKVKLADLPLLEHAPLWNVKYLPAWCQPKKEKHVEKKS